MKWTILVLLSITLFVRSDEIVNSEADINLEDVVKLAQVVNEELKEVVDEVVAEEKHMRGETEPEVTKTEDSESNETEGYSPETIFEAEVVQKHEKLVIDENGEAKLEDDSKPSGWTVYMPKECPYKTQKGDRLEVHVYGKVVSTNKEFTSSHRHDQTMGFAVGVGEVMPRMWDEWLLNMCPGEKKHMIIPSAYAWGEAGLPANNIAPHEDVIMDVEIVKITTTKDLVFNAPVRELVKTPTFTPAVCDYKAKEGDKLFMEYHGTLESSSEVFDSSYNRGNTFDFTLGRRQAVQGWDQGLIGICAGQRLHMIIPSAFAYGNTGTESGSIPPGDSMVQDVKCTKIVTAEGVVYEAEPETEITDMKTLYMPQECVRKPEKGDKVWVAYDGRLESVPEIIFDTSYQYMYGRTHPFVFEFGAGQAIEGFEELIGQMCIGEKRHAVVPPSKAYGRHGDGNIIPPDARLDYSVEIIRIDDTKGVSHFASSDKNVTKEGDCEIQVEDGDTLKLQYQGYMQVTMDLFEKSKEEEDHEVVMGKTQIFKDLAKHFIGMCSGEHASIVIPQKDAFGSEGHSTLGIPPYASLVFNVQMNNIIKDVKVEL